MNLYLYMIKIKHFGSINTSFWNNKDHNINKNYKIKEGSLKQL